jgi:hypothetical protein
MHRDPDHICIAHILQHKIEYVVQAMYKVTNMMWYRCCGGGGLSLTFHCVP